MKHKPLHASIWDICVHPIPVARWFRALVDYLFGYDFFISYAHGDGHHYPRRLSELLEESGFRVFLDERVYVPGDDLHVATRRRIRMSKKLIVLVRPMALGSDWVLKEIHECREAQRTPIVIDVNCTLENADNDSKVKTQLRDKLYISETRNHFDEEPSDHVIAELIRSFQSMRQDALRLRIVSSVAIVLAIVAIIAIWQYLLAEQRQEIAYSRQLAASALSQLPGDPELSTLLAVESLAVRHTTEAEDALRSGLAELFIHTTIRGNNGEIVMARYNSDASQVVTADFDQTARIWDTDSGELMTEMKGHKNYLTDAAFSPDDQYVVTSSHDKTVRIWDAESGALKQTFKGKDTAWTARFSPDGKRIAAAGFNFHVHLWDVVSGKEILTLETDFQRFISNDGRWLISIKDKDIITLWDAETGNRTAEIKGIQGSMIPDGLSKDGTRIITELGKEILVWNFSTGNVLARLVGHDAPVTTADFSSNMKKLVTGGEDYTARIWHLSTDKAPIILRGHTDIIKRVDFSPDNRWIVTASADRTARIWDAISGRLIAELRGHNDGIKSAVFDYSSTFVLTAGDNTARIWRVTDEQAVTRFWKKHDPIRQAAINKIGGLIVTAGLNKFLTVWGARTGIEVGQIKNNAIPMQVAFHTNSRHIAVAGFDGKVRVWDELERKEVAVFDANQKIAISVAFSPDGKRLVSTYNDKIVRVWKPKQSNPVTEFHGHTGRVLSAHFSPDGNVIASGGDDKSVRLWNASTGNPIGKPMLHLKGVRSVAFNHDGKFVVTTTIADTAYLWNVTTGKLVTTVQNLAKSSNAVFTPDGRWIVTASKDSKVIVLDAMTGNQVSEMPVHAGPVQWLTVSDDGRWLLTTENDEAAYIYPWEMVAPLDDLHTIAKERLHRTLTEDERLQFLKK